MDDQERINAAVEAALQRGKSEGDISYIPDSEFEVPENKGPNLDLGKFMGFMK